jgi:hypothetical protein
MAVERADTAGTQTLVHDPILQDAEERRRKPKPSGGLANARGIAGFCALFVNYRQGHKHGDTK